MAKFVPKGNTGRVVRVRQTSCLFLLTTSLTNNFMEFCEYEIAHNENYSRVRFIHCDYLFELFTI